MLDIELEELSVTLTLRGPRHPLGPVYPSVLIPYTRHYPEALAAVERAAIPARYVPCVGDDDYYEYIHELWANGQTFTIIEHDITPRPGDWQQLLDCPHPWCGFVYCITTQYCACNGFTKYDTSLMRSFPDLMDWVGDRTMADDGSVQRHWVRLDTRMSQYLHNHGYTIHEHWPPVPHLNDRQAIRVEVDNGFCRWPAEKFPCS